MNEKDKHLSANIKNGTDEVISVSLDLQGNYKMSKKRYNTYYTRDNKIYRVRLNTFLFWEKIIEMKNLRLNFGNHEISRIFEKLDVNPKPIASVYYKKAIEIADRTYLLEEGKVVLEGGREMITHKKIKSVYLGGRY